METKFGPSQLVSTTPQWARWMFRIVFILTTVAAFIIASDPGITDPLKVRIGAYLKGLDMLVFMFSKMFGVNVKEDNENAPPVAGLMLIGILCLVVFTSCRSVNKSTSASKSDSTASTIASSSVNTSSVSKSDEKESTKEQWLREMWSFAPKPQNSTDTVFNQPIISYVKERGIREINTLKTVVDSSWRHSFDSLAQIIAISKASKDEAVQKNAPRWLFWVGLAVGAGLAILAFIPLYKNKKPVLNGDA